MQRSSGQQPGGRQQGQHGRKVIENLRKQSLMSPPAVPAVPAVSNVHRQSYAAAQNVQSPSSYDTQIGFSGSLGAPSSVAGGRMPGLGPHTGAHPYSQHQGSGQQTPPRRSDSPGDFNNVSPSRPTAAGAGAGSTAGVGLSRLERMRLAAQEAPQPVPAPTPSKPVAAIASSGPRPQPPSGAGGSPASTLPRPNTGAGSTGGKKPQTFAEMGFHGAKADDKDCVIM